MRRRGHILGSCLLLRMSAGQIIFLSGENETEIESAKGNKDKTDNF